MYVSYIQLITLLTQNPPPNKYILNCTICNYTLCCCLTQPICNLHEYCRLPSPTLLPVFLNWLFNLEQFYKYIFSSFSNRTFSIQLSNLTLCCSLSLRFLFPCPSNVKIFFFSFILLSPSVFKCPSTVSSSNIFFLPFFISGQFYGY